VTACPDVQLTVTQSCLAVLLQGDILKPENKRVLEKHLAKWAQWSRRVSQGVVDVRRSLLYLAIASLIVVIHRPTRMISVTSKGIPVTEVSGKNWHYDLRFPVYNSSTLERLIQCESQGLNISRIDSNGQMSWGILQFNGTSTWNEMEKRFNFYGDPKNPPDAIHMADMMISSGLIGRWTCARSLGLTK
jgi:hypothetical protein